MPGASAIGYRANPPIRKLPAAAERQVAAVTAANGIPASCRMAGLTKTMYAIVMNVVNPARISVFQSAPSFWNSKYRSRRGRMALHCTPILIWLRMHGHVRLRRDLLNYALNGLRKPVGLEQSLLPIHQHVQVYEQNRPGIAQSNVVAVLHAGHRRHRRRNPFLHARRSGIEERVDGPVAQLPTDPYHQHRNTQRGHGIAVAQKSQPRIPLAHLDRDQAEDHHPGSPDVRLKVQRVSFESLAVVLPGRARKQARPREIDHD